MDWTLEVVLVPVSDIDRAVAFYRDQVGFVLDHETKNDHMHFVQLTPRGVECSSIMVIDERDGGTLFGFSDPDGNSWAVQQIKARGETPLIPREHRS